MSNDLQRVTTGTVRLSYVNLLTPRAKKQGDPLKYSCTILIPKSDVATKQRIDAAINVAIQEDGVSKKWSGVRPPMISFPIHDGDGVRPSDGMPFGEECRGHWVLTASSNADQKPDIVDLNMNPIMSANEIYSGMYARVSFRFFAFNNNGKKGIGCGLGNVQKFDDGPRLSGGGTSAATDFGGAPAGYGAPAPGYPPVPQQAPVYPPQQPAYPQQPAAYPPAQQLPYPPQAPAYPPQPGYGVPTQPAQQPQVPQQPAYPQQQAPVYPPQPGYGQAPAQPGQQPVYPPQQPQYDPITGLPLSGPIMGL